jgi:hypothetical protein
VASWITLKGVKPYDGRYELDLDGQPLTRREWGWIKRNAGYLPVTLTGETFADPELITMLAIISMYRAGKVTTDQVPDVWERFADVPFDGVVTLEADEDDAERDDAGPPPGRKSEKPSSSGASSPTGSATSEAPPRATGSPASATSGSAPATLVI